MVDRDSHDARQRRLSLGRGDAEDRAQSRTEPKQLEPNEYVDRIRRIQLNDLETLPYFLVAGLLFVLTDPSLLLTRWLLYGFVATRLLHFAAYFTAQTHDMRASLWTPGSLILIFMTCRTLLAALSY